MNGDGSRQTVIMISLTVFCLWVVATVTCLVVRQPDGIVSIITELEPERVPVEYVQAVSTPRLSKSSAKEVAHVDDGLFRVRSTKIRVVDPKTGFNVVHQLPVVDLEPGVGEPTTNLEQSDPQIQALPASDYKVIYPTVETERLINRRKNRRFGNEKTSRQYVEQPRRSDSYGFQYPKRPSTVRTEKLTRIKNDNNPAKIYKQTIVRPVTAEDEIKENRKYGKAGRYGKYAQEELVSQRIPGIGEVVENSNIEVDGSPSYDPRRRKSQKDYSSKTVVRFPDGYAHGNERRSESSSKYRSGTNTRSNYEKPKVTTITNSNRKYDGREIPTSINEKVEIDQPVQEGSSILVSGISDGVDDGLVDGVGEQGDYRGYGDIQEGYGGGYEKEKHYENDKGKDYVAAHNSAHGAKGQKGHNNEESYAKGQSEKHGQDENKGFAVEKEGDKKSHLDKLSQFSEGHKASEGESGKDYHKEKGHKKGHKKSGFRTVHHKDEYKKNEEFYDEEHNSGDEQKHGHKSEHQGHKAGGHDKKAYLDSGHHQASRGHEGGHEKGHGYNHQKGYQKDKGHSGHYGNEEEYGKKAGHKEGEVHGHSEYGSSGYH